MHKAGIKKGTQKLVLQNPLLAGFSTNSYRVTEIAAE